MQLSRGKVSEAEQPGPEMFETAKKQVQLKCSLQV